MRILGRYILSSFLVTFLASLTVLTFVLSIGVIFKITDLLARGVPAWPVLEILALAMPGALSYAIPVSLLASSLLVFSRLSADSEITAMKACGISMWSIVGRPVALSLLPMALCLYVNLDVAPRTHMVRRESVARLGLQAPLELLEEGRFIDEFDGLSIHIARRSGDRLISLRIIDSRDPGFRREIRAESATVLRGANGLDMILELNNVRIEPFQRDRPGAGEVATYQVAIPNALAPDTVRRRPRDMGFRELARTIVDPRRHYAALAAADVPRQRLMLVVEMSKRLVLAGSCFTFVLLGCTLGVRSHRRESSVGIALSLLVMFVFFLFIALAETMAKQPQWHPEVIIWMPVVISFGLGAYLLRRLD